MQLTMREALVFGLVTQVEVEKRGENTPSGWYVDAAGNFSLSWHQGAFGEEATGREPLSIDDVLPASCQDIQQIQEEEDETGKNQQYTPDRKKN